MYRPPAQDNSFLIENYVADGGVLARARANPAIGRALGRARANATRTAPSAMSVSERSVGQLSRCCRRKRSIAVLSEVKRAIPPSLAFLLSTTLSRGRSQSASGSGNRSRGEVTTIKLTSSSPRTRSHLRCRGKEESTIQKEECFCFRAFPLLVLVCQSEGRGKWGGGLCTSSFSLSASPPPGQKLIWVSDNDRPSSQTVGQVLSLARTSI